MTIRPTDRPVSAGDGEAPDRFLVAVAADGEVRFAGPSVPAVLGVERRAFVGDDFLEYVHPEAESAVSDALSPVASDRRVTHRVRTENGGYVWVESVVDDALAPAFDGRVVTSRRVDVDRTVPDRYREFLECGTDIVTVVDADARIRYQSPSVEDVLGYDRGSLVGRSPLSYVHPDDSERVAEEFDEALSDPDRGATLEYRSRTADGDWVWLESRARALPADAAVGRLVVNSRDVTERKRRERRLADRNERLDRFASIVSHDLRNPLSVVRASMETAQVDGDTEPLDRGVRAADRIERLVTELLTLARQGTEIDDAAEFPLADVVRDAWGTAGTDDAEFRVVDDARVRADRSRLRRALENLFRNCVEHAATGEAADDLTVAVSATDAGFVVADDGPGIDSDCRDRVFESGYTTHADGTGYGLDIVREIVEAHGWRVTVADEVDADERVAEALPRGARFAVRAPAPAAADDGAPWVER